MFWKSIEGVLAEKYLPSDKDFKSCMTKAKGCMRQAAYYANHPEKKIAPKDK